MLTPLSSLAHTPSMYKHKQDGFTIVELLIVIVVVGVLAAISIVAFSGLQQRARASEASAYVNNGMKVIGLYKAANGSYPTMTGCIGSGYIDRNADGSADCRWNSSGSTWTVNSSLNTALSEYASVNFEALDMLAANGSVNAIGAAYYYNAAATLDGVPHSSWFVYAVTGQSKCPMGPIVRLSAWNILVTDASAALSEPWTTGGTCWIPLR